MARFYHTTGILDVITLAGQWDTTVVFPTLPMGIEWWRMYRTAVNEMHGKACVINTRTASITRCNNRQLRLWVPYEEDPTMPMDFPIEHAFRCDYISPFFSVRELKRIAHRM